MHCRTGNGPALSGVGHKPGQCQGAKRFFKQVKSRSQQLLEGHFAPGAALSFLQIAKLNFSSTQNQRTLRGPGLTRLAL